MFHNVGEQAEVVFQCVVNVNNRHIDGLQILLLIVWVGFRVRALFFSCTIFLRGGRLGRGEGRKKRGT